MGNNQTQETQPIPQQLPPQTPPRHQQSSQSQVPANPIQHQHPPVQRTQPIVPAIDTTKREVHQQDDIPNYPYCYPEEIFVDKPSTEFECPISLGIINNAYSDKCGHIFCKNCIFTWLKQKSNCPLSKQPLKAEDLYPIIAVNNFIQKQKSRCIHAEKGCTWQNSFELLPKHIKMECQYVRLKCKYPNCKVYKLRKQILAHETNCEHVRERCRFCRFHEDYTKIQEHYAMCPEMPIDCIQKCSDKVKRKDMPLHITKACVENIVECDLHCGQSVKKKDLGRHKVQQCPETMVTCDLHCGRALRRKDLQAHRVESCPNFAILCSFWKFGCKEKPLRKNFEEHLASNTEAHARLVNEDTRPATKIKLEKKKKIKLQIIDVEKLDYYIEKYAFEFSSLTKEQYHFAKVIKLLSVIDGDSVEELTIDLSSITKECISDFECYELSKLISKLRSLRSICLSFDKFSSQSTSISDTGLMSLAEGFSKLINLNTISLYFRSCDKITDTGLWKLSESIPKLLNLNSIYINFAQCNLVTGNGMIQLSEGISRITYLNSLSINLANTQVDDNSVIKLSEILMKLLRLNSLELNFTQCSRITSIGIVQLGANILKMPNIKSVGVHIQGTNSDQQTADFLGEIQSKLNNGGSK